MVININEDWKVSTDRYNWILQQRTVAGKDAKKPGEVSWEAVSYHGNLEQAVLHLHRHGIKTSEESDVERILAAIKESETTIVAALQKYAEQN